MYYPTPNQTTISVGEVSDIALRPHAMTNITFPMQLLSSSFDKTDSNTSTEATNNKNSAFRSIVSQLCSIETEDSGDSKEIDIVYDLMPTFKFGDYGALSLSFTGQTTKISCEKVCMHLFPALCVSDPLSCSCEIWPANLDFCAFVKASTFYVHEMNCFFSIRKTCLVKSASTTKHKY